MTLDINSKKILISLCRNYSVKKLILFGSRADDTCYERSDIDIAVQGISDMDYINLVDDVIDSDIIYSVDIVNMDSLSVSCDLLSEIKKKGVILYEKV